jgi:hypothetical protein
MTHSDPVSLYTLAGLAMILLAGSGWAIRHALAE